MREIGLVIKKKVLAYYIWVMVINMKDNGNQEKRMEKEFMNLQMEINMKDIGLKIKETDKVFTIGPMVKFIMENGKMIKCMAKAYLNLLMDKSLKAHSKMAQQQKNKKCKSR